MTTNETLIEKYFSKQLSASEFQDFEKKYDTDEDFRAEVDFLKDIQYVSETEDDSQFKKQLSSYETEFSKNKPIKSSKWLKSIIGIAAVVLIGLSLAFIFNRNMTNDQLFSTYFEPSKNVSTPIVRSESDEHLVNNAFIAYGESDYKKAIADFQRAFEQTENSELLFYEGNALLAENDVEEAIEIFKTHLSYSDALTKRTHWYLALAYLKSNQVNKAIQELKVFSKSEEKFKKIEAQSLLKKLN